MKIHLICDPEWSTGSIAKDLVMLMPDKNLVIQTWAKYREFPDEDLMIGFTMMTCGRWPSSRKRNAIHICCHPHEFYVPEIQEYFQTRPKLFFAGVSKECAESIPGAYGHVLPASARASRFERRVRPRKKIAGFIGRPTPQNVQITGPVKRPEWFLEICKRHNLTPYFSNQDFTYGTMQNFYDGIDYLFCTSSSEGGPLGTFEAALCGVPVISTKVGFWGECDMDGYFASPNDPAIERFLDSADQLAEFQFQKMSKVSMESLIPIWRSTIDFVISGL